MNQLQQKQYTGKGGIYQQLTLPIGEKILIDEHEPVYNGKPESAPIEKSKIDCAKKLFAKLSDGLVTYDHVSNYQELLNKVLK